MPMYRDSAPFFEGDKGDRRVTGWLHVAKKLAKTVEDRLKQGERERILVEFSREFERKVLL